MFEKIIDREKKEILAQIPDGNIKIYLQDLLNLSGISDEYKNYFSAEVKWWVYQEQIARKSIDYFDLAFEKFSDVFAELDSLYHEHAFFSPKNLHKTIDSSVKVRLNMICRPRTALKWFIYRGEPTKSFKEILCRMNYLSDYTYFAEGIEQWALANEVEATSDKIISSTEFENIIEKIDIEHASDFNPEQFLKLSKPIFQFFQDKDSLAIPVEALIIFADDKALYILADELEKKFYREKITEMTEQEFLNIIYSLFVKVESGNLNDNVPTTPETIAESFELDSSEELNIEEKASVSDEELEAAFTEINIDPALGKKPLTTRSTNKKLEADFSNLDFGSSLAGFNEGKEFAPNAKEDTNQVDLSDLESALSEINADEDVTSHDLEQISSASEKMIPDDLDSAFAELSDQEESTSDKSNDLASALEEMAEPVLEKNDKADHNDAVAEEDDLEAMAEMLLQEANEGSQGNARLDLDKYANREEMACDAASSFSDVFEDIKDSIDTAEINLEPASEIGGDMQDSFEDVFGEIEEDNSSSEDEKGLGETKLGAPTIIADTVTSADIEKNDSKPVELNDKSVEDLMFDLDIEFVEGADTTVIAPEDNIEDFDFEALSDSKEYIEEIETEADVLEAELLRESEEFKSKENYMVIDSDKSEEVLQAEISGDMFVSTNEEKEEGLV